MDGVLGLVNYKKRHSPFFEKTPSPSKRYHRSTCLPIPGEDQNCELAVEMSPEEVYILGNPFLRTYCSYFDYAGQRIGFSIAKQPDFK
uniref:Peptidase A1 domain-containing protein n=1 Tax=Ditylenchus dipsaci TaxID=166011 RepID=A0A915E061_9BILA